MILLRIIYFMKLLHGLKNKQLLFGSVGKLSDV